MTIHHCRTVISISICFVLLTILIGRQTDMFPTYIYAFTQSLGESTASVNMKTVVYTQLHMWFGAASDVWRHYYDTRNMGMTMNGGVRVEAEGGWAFSSCIWPK